MHVTRIQYPIGQGCFHAGRICPPEIAKREAHVFHYVYDCGSDDQKALDDAIEYYKTQVSHVDALFVSHLDNDHVSGLDRLLSAVKVDTVYVPYVNEVVLILDLIQAELGGALSASLIEATIDSQNWFTSRGAERVVRVREAPDDGSSDPDDGGERDGPDPSRPASKDDSAAHDPQGPGAPVTRSGIAIVESGYPVPIPGQGRGPHWTLVPHVDPAPPERRDKFETEMRKTLGLSPGQQLTSARLAAAMRDRSERERLRECYNEIIPRGARRMHNRVSMSLYSGPAGPENGQTWSYRVSCWPEFYPAVLSELYPHPFLFFEPEAVGWVGTGDATLDVKKVRTAWDRTYRPYRDHVATLLLPHHGSRHNFHPEVLGFPNLGLCIASAGDPSRYRHPGLSVVLAVSDQHKMFHRVSQRPETALREEIHPI